jgi:hypothetical protein
MAAHTPLARDVEQAIEPLPAGARGPRLRVAAESRTLADGRRIDSPTVDAFAAEDSALPEVVLRIPDLATAAPSQRAERFRYASQIYWVAVVLGGLLAMWLILSGKKPAERSMDEAPAWSGPTQATSEAPPAPYRAVARPGEGPSTIRTARSSDVPWPAPAASVRPSEAAPLGIGPSVSP